MATKGKLIIFEGADAAGKSFLVKRTHHQLITQGYPAKIMAFPGNDPDSLGGLVYKIHHNALSFGIKQLTDSALQALHIAAHLDAVERVIVPALENGEIVILDRFWWSTWVYGKVGNAQEAVLDHLIMAEKTMWAQWLPSVMFYVTRENPLREEPPEKWQMLKKSYEKLISRERGNYPVHIVENNEKPEQAFEKIYSVLTTLLI